MPATRDQPELVRKLQARRASYRRWNPVLRVLWTTGGFLVLAAGIAMLAFPGPAIVVIPAGLAMLSFQFAWAQWALDRGLTEGMELEEKVEARIRHADRREKALGGLGAACVAALIAGVVVVWAV